MKRQALLDVEIPRTIHLENVTTEVWPTGSEVVVRFKVTGNDRDDRVGVLRIVPEGEPEEFYELKQEEGVEDAREYFSIKLPRRRLSVPGAVGRRADPSRPAR